MVSEISALEAVDAALRLTQLRLADSPKHGVYLHAQEQLESMASALREKRSLGDVAGAIDIGLMAAKELDPSDPDLADALMLADYQFKQLAGNG